MAWFFLLDTMGCSTLNPLTRLNIYCSFAWFDLNNNYRVYIRNSAGSFNILNNICKITITLS